MQLQVTVFTKEGEKIGRRTWAIEWLAKEDKPLPLLPDSPISFASFASFANVSLASRVFSTRALVRLPYLTLNARTYLTKAFALASLPRCASLFVSTFEGVGCGLTHWIHWRPGRSVALNLWKLFLPSQLCGFDVQCDRE